MSEEIVVDEVMVKAKREWKAGMLVFGVFLIVIAGVGWGYMQLIQKTITPLEKAEIIVELPKESSKPVVEVKPVFAVWNGSGVAGAAGELADKIKSSGYEVVETKNAPQEQVGTTVEIESTVSSQQAEIMSIVGVANVPAGPGLAGYVIVPARPGPKGSLEYSVKIIIGK